MNLRYWLSASALLTIAAFFSLYQNTAEPEPVLVDSGGVAVAADGTDSQVEAISKSEKSISGLPAPDTNLAKSDSYEVLSVVDGDTIVVDINGVRETLRMIGVDTPETVHPSKPVQCFGAEASARTKSWLVGQSVVLANDQSQGERDKYGRLLAYVWRDDGLFVNQTLISEGFAFEYTYNLPYKYQTEFKAAETEAREGKKGLWADEACAESFETRSGTATFVPQNPDDRDCPDFATQSDAQVYFEAGGGSPSYNFDRLDSDRDGIACEGLP